MSDECRCIKCGDKRYQKALADAKELTFAGRKHLSLMDRDLRFRFACEICGNKRCPHHSDHTLACTNSNELGQPGSVFVFPSLSREPRDE
jgi:hypothetical protein